VSGDARWLIVALAVLAGRAIGVGIYTFGYAKGASYLTNDPGACANCHVMREQYDAWLKASHHAVAVCNDCHAPHTLAGKYPHAICRGTEARLPSGCVRRLP
jgi:cytochrome c nitrite reductase small subunit